MRTRSQYSFPVDSWHLTQQTYFSGTWKPRIAPANAGQFVARHTNGSAGLRCWKKQKPCCNGVDTNPGDSTRKRAHVQLVFHCKRIWRINFMEKSK